MLWEMGRGSVPQEFVDSKKNSPPPNTLTHPSAETNNTKHSQTHRCHHTLIASTYLNGQLDWESCHDVVEGRNGDQQGGQRLSKQIQSKRHLSRGSETMCWALGFLDLGTIFYITAQPFVTMEFCDWKSQGVCVCVFWGSKWESEDVNMDHSRGVRERYIFLSLSLIKYVPFWTLVLIDTLRRKKLLLPLLNAGWIVSYALKSPVPQSHHGVSKCKVR